MNTNNDSSHAASTSADTAEEVTHPSFPVATEEDAPLPFHLPKRRKTTALISAAISGNFDSVKALAHTVPVNHTDEFEDTALMNIAAITPCSDAHVDIAKYLLHVGAQVDMRNNKGNTSLIFAASRWNARIGAILIQAGANVDASNSEGLTALIYLSVIAREDNQEPVLLFANALVGAKADLNVRTTDLGYTALTEACRNRCSYLAMFLISSGANVDIANHRGETALFLTSDENVVQAIIDAKGNLNHRRYSLLCEDTALIVAIFEGYVGIAIRLIDAGADVNIQGLSSETALYVATRYGHETIVQSLLATGLIDVNRLEGEHDSSSLMMASWKGYEAITRHLLAAHADVNIADLDGNTALIQACAHGYEVIAQELIASGAVVNAANNEGYTALIVAINACDNQITKLLLVAGADINQVNVLTQSPLHVAILNDCSSIVARLLMEGADDTLVTALYEEDEIEMTPFEMAVALERPYAVEDAWEAMKGRMSDSKVDTILHAAMVVVTSPHHIEEETFMTAFLTQVPDGVIMMSTVMSFFLGDVVPRFFDSAAE